MDESLERKWANETPSPIPSKDDLEDIAWGDALRAQGWTTYYCGERPEPKPDPKP